MAIVPIVQRALLAATAAVVFAGCHGPTVMDPGAAGLTVVESRKHDRIDKRQRDLRRQAPEYPND